MSIQGIQNHPAYAPEKIQQSERPEAAAQNKSTAPAPRYDEYVPEEETERKSIGVYRIEPDEEGNPRAAFDAPDDEPKTERCTANTDKVDREIEKLREERNRLAEQLQSTDDPQKAAELQQRLAQLDSELRQKDNDAYRRQHTVFS